MDLLKEARETTVIHSARYQQTLYSYHERYIRGRILEVGDLVLRRTQSTKEKHKLSPPWEGPYTVTEVIRPGAYRLKDDNGNVLTNTWNIEQQDLEGPNNGISIKGETNGILESIGWLRRMPRDR